MFKVSFFSEDEAQNMADDENWQLVTLGDQVAILTIVLCFVLKMVKGSLPIKPLFGKIL